MTSTTDAYYTGRNSIDDDGSSRFAMSACPEINSPALVEAFRRGVRNIRSELRLSADTEWDEDEAAA